MSQVHSQVWIIEDDLALAESLQMLLSAAGFSSVVHFRSAEDCQKHLDSRPGSRRVPGCLLLDIRLGGMNGCEFFSNWKNEVWPVIFMTGHGDLQMAVQVLKQGALDYLTKPCVPRVLIEKVQHALEVSQTRLVQALSQQDYRDRLLTLTRHEQLVLLGILSHLTNREIADWMQNSTRTIESHRASILKKMNARSSLELAQHNERFMARGGRMPFAAEGLPEFKDESDQTAPSGQTAPVFSGPAAPTV